MDPDEGEILYGVTIETSGQCYIPASGSGSVSGLFVQFTTGIGENGNVSVNFNQAGEVSIADINRLETLMNGKVDKVGGMGLSQESYTTAEKEKLAGLESSHFRGTYVNAASLTAAIPIGIEGDYAYVGSAGQAEIIYVWDNTDSVWVQGGGATAETPASVKQKYESNPDTNAYTDAEKSKLRGLTTPVDASLTQKGIVQLSNDTDSLDDTKAVTPSALYIIRRNTSLLGKPTAPQAGLGDNSDQIANTAFVYNEIRNKIFLTAKLSGLTTVNGDNCMDFTQSYDLRSTRLVTATHNTYGPVWRNNTGKSIYVIIQLYVRFDTVTTDTNPLRYFAIATGTSLSSTSGYATLLYVEERDNFRSNGSKAYTCFGVVPTGCWILPSCQLLKGDALYNKDCTFSIAEF
jgi:hypothetical protein